MSLRVAVLVLAWALVSVARSQTTVLDFESPLPGGLVAATHRHLAPVPPQSLVRTQFANFGLVMDGVVLLNLGIGRGAPSGVNVIGSVDAFNRFNESATLRFTFVSPDDGISPATSDFFSIMPDTDNSSDNRVVAYAYGLDGRLLGTATYQEFIQSIPATPIVLTNMGPIYRVIVAPTLNNMVTGVGGIGFDLVSFSALRTHVQLPVILTPPQSQTLPMGSNATLTVAIAGTPPLHVQWYFGTTAIGGANQTNLVITNVQPAQSGSYSVAVSNDFGTVTSGAATLTIPAPGAPVIVTQPQEQLVLQGSAVSLSVGVVGAPPLFYQWYTNGTAIPNATGKTYTTLPLPPGYSAVFSVAVSNALGIAISSNALVAVFTLPVVTTPLQSQTIKAGRDATLRVEAQGIALSYAWVKDGRFIDGATNASLTVTNARFSDSGGYTVYISIPTGLAVTSDATLTIDPTPGIAVEPQGISLLYGAPAQFAVTADGEPPLNYQWRLNNSDLPNQTNTVLRLDSTSTASVGEYSVQVLNAFGSAVSRNARLDLVGPFLSLSILSNQLSLSMPILVPDFIVECTSDVGPGQVWTVITNLSTVTGNVVTIPFDPAAPARYYRLRTP